MKDENIFKLDNQIMKLREQRMNLTKSMKPLSNTPSMKEIVNIDANKGIMKEKESSKFNDQNLISPILNHGQPVKSLRISLDLVRCINKN